MRKFTLSLTMLIAVAITAMAQPSERLTADELNAVTGTQRIAIKCTQESSYTTYFNGTSRTAWDEATCIFEWIRVEGEDVFYIKNPNAEDSVAYMQWDSPKTWGPLEGDPAKFKAVKPYNGGTGEFNFGGANCYENETVGGAYYVRLCRVTDGVIDASFRINSFDFAPLDATGVWTVQNIYDVSYENTLMTVINDARERIELYGDHEGNDIDGAIDVLKEAIATAEAAVESGDVETILAAQEELKVAISKYMGARVWLYTAMVEAYRENEFVAPPYSADDMGKYPESSEEILVEAESILATVESDVDGLLAPAEIDRYYAQVEALFTQFEASAIRFSMFPVIYTQEENGLPGSTMASADLGGTDGQTKRVWTSPTVLVDENEPLNGVRLTFLANNNGQTNAGYPMIALAEIMILDDNGDEIVLNADAVTTNTFATNEGETAGPASWAFDSNVDTYYHSAWDGSSHNPDGYVYLDIPFDAPMSCFKIKYVSRREALSPTKICITPTGVAYDPQLYVENPYNVKPGNQVKSVDELTADGLYLIKGLLNTSTRYGVDEETGEAKGVAKFYNNGTSRFHASQEAVRANCVYRIIPNGDGTFSVLNLGVSKYWSSAENNGYQSTTLSKEKAAKLKIVPANTEFESSFVMYEEHPDHVSVDSIDTDEDGIYDAANTTATPYAVYMDWASGLAMRHVTKALPREGLGDDVLDSWGDSLYFNKGNGEGEWQIYKVDMDNPDFYWLTNMIGLVDNLGLEMGPDPGCVADLGELQAAFDAAQACVADSVYAEAPAIAKALSEKIVLAESLEKNPMKPGVYMITSALNDYFTNQGSTKSVYVTLDEYGAANGLRWGNTETGNVAYYFDFQLSPDASTLAEMGTITEEQAAQCYWIRAIGTTEPKMPYYIGESDAQSTQIDPVADWASNYLVLPATGSAFTISSPSNINGFCLHTNGHSAGAGVSGNLVYWNAAAAASQWRLQVVDYTTAIEDLAVEGDEVVSVAYYTVAGAASSTPSKGINIVRVVYANGVVETKKLFVK